MQERVSSPGRFSDDELGINIATLTNEELTMGAAGFLPEGIQALRAERTLALGAAQRAAQQRRDQVYNMTANVKPDRPPYFAR